MESEEPLPKKLKLEDKSSVEVTDHTEDVGMKLDEVTHDQAETSDVTDTNVESKSLDIFSVENNANLPEGNVGMNQTLNKTRFSGILKQRYSDFMVRECDMDGNLVYLTDLQHIDKPVEEAKEDTKEPPSCPISDTEELVKIEEFVSQEDQTKRMKLKADDDKEHRKLVHLFIKTKYKHIETDTVTLEDKSRAIELSFKSDKKGKLNRTDRQTNSRRAHKFCHFVLFKQNKDTMECISLLAKMLRVNTKNFSYAGTKDRRATTVQKICIQNTLSQRLSGLNQRLKNIALGNFFYSETGLNLGDLKGNEFTIVIRDVVDNSDGDIDEACTSLKERGFINYFGLQRFGTGAVPTHEVGKALLTSRFSDVCDMILKPRDENTNNHAHGEIAAQKIWSQTKDAKKAFAAVKLKYSIEGKLLDGLRKRGEKNFFEAFNAIPRNTRLLYLHSYQSLLWNKAVSKRIDEYGLHAHIGDLVLTKEKDQNGYQQVHTLTTKDIDSKNYDIYDIVLPLPGYDMKYPSNKLGDYYKEQLTADGLDIYDMRRKQKELSLSGKYRCIVVKPTNMTWDSLRYDDYTVPLIENDFDRLQVKNNSVAAAANTGNSANDDSSKSTEMSDGKLTSVVESGKYKALRLQMTLPSSCYATSALRELLINDSSFKTQLQLNKDFAVK